MKKAVAKGGREIWIAEGTYTSYDPYLSLRATFNLEKGVHLIGGFPSPSSFPGGNPTKSDIDIENHPSIIDATSSYHQVFVMEDQTSLNGIQVINQTSVQNGGVVLIEANGQHDEKNITIENCKFENITGSNGAGIYAASSQNGRINLFLENNVFTNISGNLGSNLYFKSIGSGTSVNVEVNNCIFDNASSVNSSVYGFAKTSGKVDVKVQNTLFSNAQGTSFQVNSERSGRFIFDLVNTTIVNSTLANEEPVFKIESASNANTSAFNILNAILWDEQLFEHTNNGNSTINVVHSSLKSAVCPDGIICCANTMYNEDPMFEDETLSKYTLKEGSPAIDKGTDSVDVVYDINYEPRPQGINLDLGAYESEYTASGITLDIKLFLEGTYNPTLQKMNTDYYAQNYLSLSQPFHDTPRNYTGNEAVTNYTQFERLYNGTTLQVVSWVLVNLIDQNNINNIIEQKAGLLWDNGSVTDTEHQPIKILLTPDLYYVAVIAPGHLGVMTATPFDFNQTQQIDFTNPSFAAFGGNDAQIEMAGIMTFICGDVNGDGIINAADRSPVWTKRNTIGNTKEDINRDGICNAADRTKTWNNRNRFSYLPF